MGEELAAYISQHLSGVIIPQSTAIGANSSNHHFGPVLAAAAAANQPHGSQEKASWTTAIMKTALPRISICQATSLRYGKQRNSVYFNIVPLQKCPAPADKQERSFYLLLHSFHSQFLFFLSFSKFATHCKCKERKHTRLRQRAQPF